MTLETAVVGGGVVSEDHLSGLERCPETDLVAICDLDESRAREKATDYDINAYADFEGMLAREELDWIHLCTPVGTHLELARMAIEDGIPVLIEKPVTATVEEAEELERLVEEHDATVSVVHNHNFAPAMRKARRLIDEGAIGDLRSVDLLYTGETFPDDVRRGAWAFELPGGEFEEGLPHPIYMVLSLGGYPSSQSDIRVDTSLAREYDQEFAYDSVQFQYTTDEGVLCSGTVLASDVPHKTIRVHGDRGSIEIDVVSQSVTVLDRDYQASPKNRAMANVDHIAGRVRGTAENAAAVARRRIDDDWDSVRALDSHAYQFGEEAAAIRRGGSTAVPVAEGTWTLRIMEAIRDAAARATAEQAVQVSTDGN